MAEVETPNQRRIVNYLTEVKLALQVAEQRTNLSTRQLALLQTALAATDKLATELLDHVPDAASTQMSRSDAAESEVAGVHASLSTDPQQRNQLRPGDHPGDRGEHRRR